MDVKLIQYFVSSQPHDHAPVANIVNAPAALQTATTTSKTGSKKKKQDVPIASRKNSTSIVQLRPPPPKVSFRRGTCINQFQILLICAFLFRQTLQEKRQRLEATLTRLMTVQRSTNPNLSGEMDLSYLLTGRGARTKSSRAISMAVTSIT